MYYRFWDSSFFYWQQFQGWLFYINYHCSLPWFGMCNINFMSKSPISAVKNYFLPNYQRYKAENWPENWSSDVKICEEYKKFASRLPLCMGILFHKSTTPILEFIIASFLFSYSAWSFFAASNDDCIVSSIKSEINVIFSNGHVRLIFSFIGNSH